MNPLKDDKSPWWRHRMMWLVVGGPLVVVVLSSWMAVVAIAGADEVLTANKTPPPDRSVAPAQHARNHAATPAAPKP